MHDSETGYAWAASLAHTGDMKNASEVLTAFESEQRPDGDTSAHRPALDGDRRLRHARSSTLQQALASNPTLAKAHFYSGLAYIRWEHWPEAAKEFQAELNLSPGDPDAQYHLGFVYMQQVEDRTRQSRFFGRSSLRIQTTPTPISAGKDPARSGTGVGCSAIS